MIVEQLRAAGIDATSRPLTDATMDDSVNNGNFEAAYNWDACGSVNEPWNSMNRFTTHFVVPVGQRSPGGNNYVRWDTDGTAAYTDIVDQIGTLPLGDPQIVPMVCRRLPIHQRRDAFHPARASLQAGAFRHHLLDRLADRREQLQPPGDLVEQHPPDYPEPEKSRKLNVNGARARSSPDF